MRRAVLCSEGDRSRDGDAEEEGDHFRDRPNERKAVKEINCILDPPVNMVEQDVDHESSNRHIEPSGVDPTGQTSVVL